MSKTLYTFSIVSLMSRFVLKFLWLEKSLAIGLDQKVGERTTPLTEFFFWPQVDAWEEIRLFLESNDWIDQSDSVVTLNQITEVINDWQEKTESPAKDISMLLNKYPNCVFANRL